MENIFRQCLIYVGSFQLTHPLMMTMTTLRDKETHPTNHKTNSQKGSTLGMVW